MPKATKKTTKAPAVKATKKAITKKEEPAPKSTVAGKKGKVKPVVAADENSLDVLLLLDCTASMGSWIERSKDTLKGIIENVKRDYAGLKVRVGFIGYRDIRDHRRFEIFEFSEDLDAAKSFIGKMTAMGGNDMPEDVQGGLNKALNINWSLNSKKQLFLICDAPGHGKDICDYGDHYPDGSPDGFKI